ncbi:methyltransferase domain-containing protein [Streptomyces sp. NPDC091219]|uniref:class I SAM-dependent methyltransferase n=1 Tax=Streptomyces sp. NPDC091219 TaxID=3155193 RepID=UPI00344D1E76
MSSVALRTHRLSPSDWNAWACAVPPSAVHPAENAHFCEAVGPRPGMTAIDLACGTGQWTRRLASWGFNVTGYDFSDEALRQAQPTASCGSLSYALWDIVADPIPRDLAPGSVDVVTCRYSLPFLEPGRLLTDVGRWLKPKGVFYALVHTGAGADGDAAGHRVRAGAAVDSASFDAVLDEVELSTIGAGWTRNEVHPLGRDDCTIVLGGYDGPALPPAPTTDGGASEIRLARVVGDGACTRPAARVAASGNGRAGDPSGLQPVAAHACTAQV